MFEFFFKYSPTVYDDSEFILANEWPVALLYTLIALSAIVLVATVIWRRGTMHPLKLATIGLLQVMMAAVVLVVLWQPALLTEQLVTGENAVAVMLDTSSSMAVVDGDTSRMTRARNLLEGDGLEDLAETYTVLPYTFDANARSLDAFVQENLPPPGNATNLGQSLLQALRQSGNASLGSVIVVSDGADNTGSISQADLNEIAAFGVPVHTVGIGREAMPEDLELEDVALPDKALPGTTLTARLTIRHDQGGVARVKVYDGEDFLTTQDVQLSPEQNLTMAFVDIDVPDPGQLDLRFTLDPLAGERNLTNNARSRVVDVPESRYRILYFEGEPRWEYKFMQRALADDPSIQLTTLLRVTPNKFYRQGIDGPEQLADGFPTESSELYDYDALIIGSVDVAEFNESQHQMIRDFVSERGGSLLMLAGLNGLGQGGWEESVVNEILPARLSFEDEGFTRSKAPVVLTDSGRNAPMLQLSSSDAENQQLWNSLPEVADYQGMGRLRPAATALLDVNIDGRTLPLLVTQPYGRGQTYILATGGTWRWQMSLPVEDVRHETFWRQLARGLVANSPRPFELSTVIENEEIKVRAEIRDPNAEENQGLTLSAVVNSENNESFALDMTSIPGQPSAYEASFAPPGEGLYTIEALQLRDNEPVNSARTAARYDQGLEAFNTRQNRALLERISEATGGRYWTPAQWDQIPEAISYSTAGITEQDVRYLWDAPFIFLVLILLKALEWTLRRVWRRI